jgi:hypothetical protein
MLEPSTSDPQTFNYVRDAGRQILELLKADHVLLTPLFPSVQLIITINDGIVVGLELTARRHFAKHKLNSKPADKE